MSIEFASGSAKLETPEGNRVALGSGVAVTSDNSISGCGCCCSIKILKWEECNTLAKKIGFVFGKVINFFIRGFSTVFEKLKRVCKILYFDRITNFFHKILSLIYDKISKIANFIFSHLVKPIFINRFTKALKRVDKILCLDKITNFFNKIFSFTYDKISKIANFIFSHLVKPIFVNRFTRALGRFLNKYIFEPISSKLEIKKTSTSQETPSRLRQTISKILNFIYRFSFKPIVDYVLSPVGNFIADTFHGIASGTLQEEKPLPERIQGN